MKIRHCKLKQNVIKTSPLSHLGVLIHSQPGGGGFRPPLRNFASLHPNQTKFGVTLVRHKKKIN